MTKNNGHLIPRLKPRGWTVFKAAANGISYKNIEISSDIFHAKMLKMKRGKEAFSIFCNRIFEMLNDMQTFPFFYTNFCSTSIYILSVPFLVLKPRITHTHCFLLRPRNNHFISLRL